MTRLAKTNLFITVLSVAISSFAVIMPAVWFLSGKLEAIEQRQSNTCEKVVEIKENIKGFISKHYDNEQEIFVRMTKLEVDVKRSQEDIKEIKSRKKNGV